MYRVTFAKAAARGIQRIPAKERAHLLAKIETLAESARTIRPWAKPLTGRPGLRVRQGDYRAILLVNHEAETLTVLEAGHRKDVYR